MSNFSETFAHFKEKAKEFAFPPENPETLAKNIRKQLKIIENVAINLSQETQNLNAKNIETSEKGALLVHPLLRGEMPELEAQEQVNMAVHNLFLETEKYIRNIKNPQTSRIQEAYTAFLESFNESKIKDLPQIIEVFCSKIEQIK